ncbi:hypothetical protein L0222_08120, partial [bacterium]|nr:hypothetical protein [bacterium]
MITKKWISGLLVALFCLTLSIAGSIPAKGKTSGAGINTDVLNRIYSILRGHVQRGELPGAVVLLARKGKII